MTMRHLCFFTLFSFVVGCGPGTGTAKFTTWGEEYIEEEIPADPQGQDGFIDGWTLHYDKFLVTFFGITVADGKGTTGATMEGSRLVDNAQPGRKDLVTFSNIAAQAWDQVGYQIKPAKADSVLVSATEDDRAMMVAGGFSVYVAGSATKPDGNGGNVVKTFRWGFNSSTQYKNCLQAAESGTPIEGVVVAVGGTDVSELTTHGDHLYYDRLKASPDPAIQTSLRFDEKAAADTNNDGEITLAELDAKPIDVTKYDPSGFDAPTLGSFMRSLVRTVGHFRGEGECNVSSINQ